MSFDLPSGKHIFLNTAEKKDNILTGSTSKITKIKNSQDFIGTYIDNI